MGMFDLIGDVVNAAADALGSVVDTVVENPVASITVGIATVATGGAAWAFAGPIAATIGATGLLGTTSAGTAISSLTGAALTNASLAALGGGAVAAGGGGIAAGTMAVAGCGATVGAAASGVAAAAAGKMT